MNKWNILSYINNAAEKIEDNSKLLEAIERARLEMEAARNFFNNVDDNILLDEAIYKEAAAKKRYDYLINEAKNSNIKVSNEYIIDKCIESVE